MTSYSPEEIKHIEIVQSAITRIAQNSHTLKAVAATIVAVVFGFNATLNEPSGLLFLGGLFPILALWGLDANYVRLNRMFVKIHDGIVAGNEPAFNMNPDKHKSEVDDWLLTCCSWSVLYYYGAMAVLMLAFAVGSWIC